MVSISEFLDALGFENMLLIAVFLISFAIINFTLKRAFKRQFKEPSNAVTSVIAFVVAMLITYGVNAMQIDLGSFFFDMGIDSAMLEMIVYLVVLAGIGFILWKFGFAKMLMLTGVLLIAVSLFTDWFYEKEILLLIGGIICGVSLLIFWFQRKKKEKEGEPSASLSAFDREREERRRAEHRDGTIRSTNRPIKTFKVSFDTIKREYIYDGGWFGGYIVSTNPGIVRQSLQENYPKYDVRIEIIHVDNPEERQRIAAAEAARQNQIRERRESAARAIAESRNAQELAANLERQRQQEARIREAEEARRRDAENRRALDEATARNLERQEAEARARAEEARRAAQEAERQRQEQRMMEEKRREEAERKAREIELAYKERERQEKEQTLAMIKLKNQELAQVYAEYQKYLQFIKMRKATPHANPKDIIHYEEQAREMYRGMEALKLQIENMQSSLI